MRPALKRQLPLILILATTFWLGVNTITRKGPTADEPVHLTRGITLWQTGDFRFQQEHTPLSHWLIGTIVHDFPNIPAVDKLPGWQEKNRLSAARALLWERDLPVETVLFVGRLPILLLVLVGVAAAMHWAADLSGRRAAVLAGLLLGFDPNLLAHGSLATTDATAAIGYLIALFALWRYLQRPTTGHLLLAGVALGFGIAAKMTGALLVPTTAILLWINNDGCPKSDRVRALVALFFTAGLIVWGVYRFTWGPVSLTAAGLTLPLPAPAYWGSLLGVNGHISGGHQAFFLGDISSGGWLTYFPVAFGIKTPVFTLILTSIAVWMTVRDRRWRETAVFWLPAALLFTFATFSRLNIGYRHILPMLPLLIIWGAAEAASLTARTHWRQHLLSAGLLIYLLMQLWVHPHHLAFFNPLVGGPAAGARYLGDSNLDWGQDWQTAGEIIAANRDVPTYVLPFGFLDMSYYELQDNVIVDEKGLPQKWFYPANPPPGDYFLSINGLQGLLPEPDLLDYFRRISPSQKRVTGYSIYIFNRERPEVGSWIAHCNRPAPILSNEEAERWLGVLDEGVRHVYFDCDRSWVFPNDGDPGWLILPRGRPLPAGLSIVGAEDHLRLVYSHQPTTAAPAFDVYHWSGGVRPPDLLSPLRRPAGSTLVSPFGAEAISPTSWVVGWEILSPTDHPLSMFAHLYADGETPAAVDDGLGYTTEQWRPGDRFLQFHTFSIEKTPIHLQSGPYNFVTGERLDVPVEIPFEQTKR